MHVCDDHKDDAAVRCRLIWICSQPQIKGRLSLTATARLI